MNTPFKCPDVVLTTQQKLDLLENINLDSLYINLVGLCNILQTALLEYNIKISSYSDITNYIDLFTFEHASKFSSRILLERGSYWFYLNSQGHQERKNFINWMKKEYRKQLKHYGNTKTRI